MAKRRKKSNGPGNFLLIGCIVTGIATLVIRLLNNQMRIAALDILAGYTGTAFVICLLIIAGIWIVNYIKSN